MARVSFVTSKNSRYSRKIYNICVCVCLYVYIHKYMFIYVHVLLFTSLRDIPCLFAMQLQENSLHIPDPTDLSFFFLSFLQTESTSRTRAKIQITIIRT